MAIALAACGNPDPGVEADRSDRTAADAATTPSEPITSDQVTTAPPVSTEPVTTQPVTTEPEATDPPTTDEPETTPPATDPLERPPAPAASGPGSVSADDLDGFFLPLNPGLLGPAMALTDGRDPQTFLEQEMVFSGLDPVIEIPGAPITFSSVRAFFPTFDEDGDPTEVAGFSASYRMAVEFDEDGDVDERAEALRDQLRPIVEAAHPDETVTDTLGEAPLGNPVYGLRVGPEDNPSTTIEIDQHYYIVPRPVEDPLLAIRVERAAFGGGLELAEMPGRSRFVDDALQTQIELLESVPVPDDEPVVRSHVVSLVLPSAGTPIIHRSVEYSLALPADGFDTYVDDFAAVVEADAYESTGNFGDLRTFDHEEERFENEFILRREDDGANVIVRGDSTAYPN